MIQDSREWYPITFIGVCNICSEVEFVFCKNNSNIDDIGSLLLNQFSDYKSAKNLVSNNDYLPEFMKKYDFSTSKLVKNIDEFICYLNNQFCECVYLYDQGYDKWFVTYDSIYDLTSKGLMPLEEEINQLKNEVSKGYHLE